MPYSNKPCIWLIDLKAWLVMIERGFTCGLSSAIAVSLLWYHKFVQKNENPNCCRLRWKPCDPDCHPGTINPTGRHQNHFFYLVSKFFCRFERTAGAREVWGLGSHPSGSTSFYRGGFNNFCPNPLLPSLKTSPTVVPALCVPGNVFLASWAKLIQALWRLQSLEIE